MRPITLGLITSALLSGGAIAQHPPAIRQLGPTLAVGSEALGDVVFVRHLKNGVLVNDIRNRRLLMFDSALKSHTVIADTTAATANAYSGRTASLIAYRADSTLFVDPQSMSMLVIDPEGKLTSRVMSIPRSQDAMVLGNSTLGSPAFDGTGRLVYRSFTIPRPVVRQGASGGAVFTPPEIPDTTAVVRVDLTTRQLDTVAFIRIPRVKMDVQRDDNGNVRITAQMNPLPVIDDWAVLADGSIAIVRGRDYHVDWVRPDGSRESSPKMAFEWQRLTDEDKVAFIDSVKAARERMAANAPATAQPTPGAGRGGVAGGGPVMGGGGERIMIMGGPGGGGPPPGMGRELTFVSPSELPDYKPPFLAGSVRADTEGNLWIRTIPTKAIAGGPVYDVVNARGELVERVQLPRDRTIVGFGEGVVYLVARETGAGATSKLEKARVK